MTDVIEYLDDYSEFVAKVNKGISDAFDSGRIHPSKVGVMLLDWSGSDIISSIGLDRYRTTFQRYGFDVNPYTLMQDRKPKIISMMLAHYQSWLAHYDDKNALVICVYSGHCKISEGYGPVL